MASHGEVEMAALAARAEIPIAPETPGAVESDLSLRKLGVVAVCLLGSLFGSSILPYTALNLVMVPLSQEFGWSLTAISGAFTVLMWTGALTSPVVGGLADRYGVRPTIIIGTVIVGLITLALAWQNSSIILFYLLFAGLGIFGSTVYGYSKVIGALFDRNRGKALAIFGTESTIAMAFTPLLILFLLNNFGWRGVFIGLAIMVFAVVPVLIGFLAEPGAKKAVRPDGEPAPALQGMTAAEARRTRDFWLLSIAIFANSLAYGGLMAHLVPISLAHGFSNSDAAMILMVSMLGGVVGQIALGFILDKTASVRVVAPFMVIFLLGLVVMGIATANFGGIILFVAGSVLYGIGSGAPRAAGTYFNTRLFGLKGFTEIVGMQMSIFSLGFGFAPLIVGGLHDATGSYDLSFVVMGVSVGIAALFYCLIGRYRYT